MRGFIALVSIVLIAGFLLVLVASASFRNLSARTLIVEREYKETGRRLAEACIERVRLRLIEEPAYAGGDSISIDGTDCAVSEVDRDTHSLSYDVRILYIVSSSRYRVEVDPDDLSIQSVREIPSAE